MKRVFIFVEPKVLLAGRSLFGRAGEPVLSPARGGCVCVCVCVCVFVFRECLFGVLCVCSVHVVGNVLSTTVHCSIVHLARHAMRARGFDQRSLGISDRSVGVLRSTGPKFERS